MGDAPLSGSGPQRPGGHLWPAPKLKNCSRSVEKQISIRRLIEQTHLNLAIRTVLRNDQHRYALRLLNVVLGENMSSRLFGVVGEQHGHAFDIQSATSFWADAGDLVTSADLDHRELTPTLSGRVFPG